MVCLEEGNSCARVITFGSPELANDLFVGRGAHRCISLASAELKQLTQKFLHPDRQGGETRTEIVADRLSMLWILEQAAQLGLDALTFGGLGQHVVHPV